MSTQSCPSCPYHNRLQKDVNNVESAVCDLREWRAASEERLKAIEDKLDRTIKWMQWAVALSATTTLGLLSMLVALLSRW